MSRMAIDQGNQGVQGKVEEFYQSGKIRKKLFLMFHKSTEKLGKTAFEVFKNHFFFIVIFFLLKKI